MRITNNNVNFASKIKIIDTKIFNQKLTELGTTAQEVPYPWTVETMECGKTLYTTKILDCIAVGFTNGISAALAHLGIRNKEQAKKDNVKEFDINNIEENFAERINLNDKKLHGFIFGGMQVTDKPLSGNAIQVNQIKALFEKYKIPYSIFALRKDVHYFGSYSLLFDQNIDTLFITNNLFGAQGLRGKNDKNEMEIEPNGNITYNTYKKIFGKYGVDYIRERKTTNTKEFLESQFKEVALNEFDTFA